MITIIILYFVVIASIISFLYMVVKEIINGIRRNKFITTKCLNKIKIIEEYKEKIRIIYKEINEEYERIKK